MTRVAANTIPIELDNMGQPPTAGRGLDDGPELPAKVIDRTWRRRAVKSLHARGWSLRDIGQQVGCSHERARVMLGEDE